MSCCRLVFAVCVGLLLAETTLAADPPLMTASGQVVKANASVLIVRPRNERGQFASAIPLKLSGTSKASTVATQMRAGKPVLVQRDIDPKDLQPNQTIAIIYTQTKDEYVLLAAVVQPAGGK